MQSESPACLAAKCFAIQLASLLVAALPLCSRGEVNSWTNPSSGNWEEPQQWSLGVLPGAGQSVAITNEGWKAVAIGSNTTQNFPESLSADSVTVSSPPSSFNTLLLNYAGFETPLAARFVTVSSNAAMTLLSSALTLTGGSAEGLSVGGTFTQDDFSVVTGSQLDVGYIGPGVYDFNSGTLAVNHVWVGGSFGGVFNQNGGSNGAGIVHLEGSGIYVLNDGDFNATVYFDNAYPYRPLLHQKGGRLHSGLTIHNGDYTLEGGVNYGSITAPVTDGWCYFCGSAGVIQTGGTNLGSIQLGTYGTGVYVLSNGVSRPESISVGAMGQFQQSGGTQVVSGALRTTIGSIPGRDLGWGSYSLSGGMLSVAAMELEGPYAQSGGTNIVTGDITIVPSISLGRRVWLSGGWLSADNVSAPRGIAQSGGVLVVTNQLTVHGVGAGAWWPDLDVTGGQLVISNLVLLEMAEFSFANQTVVQSGLLTLRAANLLPRDGSHQFGPLRLDSEGPFPTSSFTLPKESVCVVRFGDSRSVTWANTAVLIISNWSGSLSGGGLHQIVFGADFGALTPGQVKQIYFRDPAGLAAGLYTARIRTNGEVVPDALPPTGRVQPTMLLAAQSESAMLLRVLGESGVNYAIETSSNLVDWTFWTNGFATNGVVSVSDAVPSGGVPRFYRAVLMP